MTALSLTGQTVNRIKMRQRQTTVYAINVFSFLILGREMTGAEFAEEIKKVYPTDNPKTKACVTAIENNLASIKVRRDGFTQYSLKH